MKSSLIKLVVLAILMSGVYLAIHPKKLVSAPPTNVKDVLSNSQLSYFGRLGVGNSQGSSILTINLDSGTQPNITTNNLFVGDTIAIGTTGAGAGSTGPTTKYIVKDIANTGVFQINTGLGQSNTFVGAAIIATRSAIHTITFTPQSNSTGGFWQFLIKATSRAGEEYNDGTPDQQGFDLGQDVGGTTVGLGTRLKVTDVTCPNWGIGTTTAYSVGTTAVVDGSSYHVITCSLGVGGTNQVGVGYSASIGRDLATGSQLINPSAANAHTEGNADVYTFYLRHLDNSQTLISSDTLQGKIAVVEAVRVTATVDPTLTFTIDATGVGVGATPCGLSAFGAPAGNTTATAVSYGSLALGSANDLAQRLSCVTNSDGGYVVTAYEDSPMRNIADGTTIPNTDCGGNGCTASGVGTSWTTYTASGWGYTMHNINVTNPIFSYGNYRPFGSGSSNAQEIMKNTGVPTATERAYICYRLTASTTQQAGNYESKLVYTATSTF
ncbi:hypothetical protein KBC75_01610 [Candidatus Shapirobacteria bacterium]|nr:hypothetical protein [Candidatus Shapirobacteria bacterium]